MLLSAIPTGWRTSSRLAHETTPLRAGIKLIYVSAAAVGDQTFLTGLTTRGKTTDLVSIYNARTTEWSRIALPEASSFNSVVPVGNSILFANGYEHDGHNSNVVDVYDTVSGLHTSTRLLSATGSPEQPFRVTAVGNFVVFDTGDIYDGATGQWSRTQSLQSDGYHAGAATSVGNLAIFAGGFHLEAVENGFVSRKTDEVHIFDAATGQWTSAHLSEARGSLAATTVGNLALFAGGDRGGKESDAVDIYNAMTGQWSVAHLSIARGIPAATSVGNFAVFAGGVRFSVRGGRVVKAVDVYDAAHDRWFTTRLSSARKFIGAATAGGKALFAGGTGPRSNVLDAFTPIPDVAGAIAGKAGGLVTVSFSNQSNSDIPAGATVSVYASFDGLVDDATALGAAVLPQGLTTQGFTRLGVETSISSLPVGRYHLIAALDDGDGQGPLVIAAQAKTFAVKGQRRAGGAAAAYVRPEVARAGAWPFAVAGVGKKVWEG